MSNKRRLSVAKAPPTPRQRRKSSRAEQAKQAEQANQAEEEGDQGFFTPPEEETELFYTPKGRANNSGYLKKALKLEKVKNNITSKYLRKYCSENSSACLIFGGNESRRLKQYFGNFTDPTYLVAYEKDRFLKPIGRTSVNGFVFQLQYKRDKITSYAVLKSNRKNEGDSLAYEFIVGKKFVNLQCLYFPCFVETYSLLQYETKVDERNKVEDHNYNRFLNEHFGKIGRHPIEGREIFGKDALLKPYVRQHGIAEPPYSRKHRVGQSYEDIDFKRFCGYNKYMAILVQHIANAKCLKDFKSELDFAWNDLVHVFYQIYMPLAALCADFTHYDLHHENVILYKPVEDGYILYRYHLEGDVVVQFKSPYVVKIIDYGRSYFHTNSSSFNVASTEDVKMYVEKTCRNGKDQGFWQIMEKGTRNISQDLLLADYVKSEFRNKGNLEPILNRLVFNHGKHFTDEKASSTRNSTRKSGPSTTPIRNVIDMHNALKEYILSNVDSSKYDHPSFKHIGTLNIHYDRETEMQFVPADSARGISKLVNPLMSSPPSSPLRLPSPAQPPPPVVDEKPQLPFWQRYFW